MKLFEVLFLLIASIGLTSAFDLNCIFGYNTDSQYYCVNLNLVLHHNGKVEKVSGVKQRGTLISDVTLLHLTSDNTRFIPRNILNHFPKLNRFHFNCKPRRNLTSADNKVCLSQDSLFNGVFNGWSKVNSVVLQGHSLNTLKANTFNGLDSLVNLFLSDNEIRTISQNAFMGLKKLVFLQLNGNHIKEIEAGTFDDLINLESLALYGNALKTLALDHLRNNRKLLKIGMLNNRLQVIDNRLIDNIPRVDLIRLKNNICVDSNLLNEEGNMIAEFKTSVQNCTIEDAQLYDLSISNRRLNVEHKYLKEKVGAERKTCSHPKAREMIDNIFNLQRDIEHLSGYREKYLRQPVNNRRFVQQESGQGLKLFDEKPAMDSNLLKVLNRNKKMLEVNARLVKSIKGVVSFMDALRIEDCVSTS